MKKLILSFLLSLATVTIYGQQIEVSIGEQFPLDIEIEGDSIVAWQATLSLPEGIELTKKGSLYNASLSDRCPNSFTFQIIRRSTTHEKYLILCYNLSLQPIEPGKGPVASLILKANEKFEGQADITITDIVVSNKEGKSLRPDNKTYKILCSTTYSGISSK